MKADDATVGVTIWIDKKRGSASTNEMEDESLKVTVALAEQLARINIYSDPWHPELPAHNQYRQVCRRKESSSCATAFWKRCNKN